MDLNPSTEVEVVTDTMVDDASCADSSLLLGKRKAETPPPAGDSDDDDGGEEESKNGKDRNSESDDQCWGYDSFDGLDYESPVDPPKDDSEIEYRRYIRHIRQSKGFKVDEELTPRSIRGLRDLDLEACFIKPNISGREYMTKMANVAIEKYNQMENKMLKLDSIKRASVVLTFGIKAYITFMAKEDDNNLVEYQAKAERKGWQKTIHPIFCRLAPQKDN